MKQLALGALQIVAGTFTYVFGGVILLAVAGVVYFAITLRKTNVLATPKHEQALRGDAEVLAARIEALSTGLLEKAQELGTIAKQVKEGK